MMDEGVVKYNLSFTQKDVILNSSIESMQACRERLFDLGMIGAYDNGIGYGNISVRHNASNSFIITATQTGHKAILSKEDYSLVERIDFDTFSTYATGMSKPSSEAITHGCIYGLDRNINAVIHVHNEKLWRFMLDNEYLSTNDTPYGTPKMVEDVREIYHNLDALEENIFVMKGHFEGVVCFGTDLKSAEKKFYEVVKKLLK
jgi:ribulose-5-phosphate 4-epimerase/fuculose-1-phosphate aldolase